MDGIIPQLYILLTLISLISFILILLMFFNIKKKTKSKVLFFNIYLSIFNLILFLCLYQSIIGDVFLNYIIFPEVIIVIVLFIKDKINNY